ncbi:phosphate ABC transporter substrate-binding/OmpA family protein [Oceanobacter mangrovi]|uniref:phosphate ABC transporter substrate-binding/OmpA family protein n=1 Tax=Oceanobacter mangrovi TaxID=2862510 RepID=UPI001C8E7AB1|nr:OmpA family protein [Oceanobacter mangrovi]
MAQHKHIALSILLVGAVTIAGYATYNKWQQVSNQKSVSDSAQIRQTLTVGVDGWVGYFPLCSSELQKRLYLEGIRLDCVNDYGDYASRYQALSSGKLDLAVGTVDSWLLHGQSNQWAASMIAVIDESKGGDALVGWADQVASLDDLKQGDSRIALTPNSPSHQLLKSLAVHFDIERLRQDDSWARYTDGSQQALAALQQHQVAAAVLWEPDVSKALQIDGIKRLIGTESTEGVIVDILLANRDFASKNPDALRTVLNAYFRTLRYYRSQPDTLNKDLQDWTGLKTAQNAELVRGVGWAGLQANAERWFGITDALADIGLVQTIQDTRATLQAFASQDKVNLPDNDPFRLIYSNPLKQLYSVLQNTGDLAEPGNPTTRFTELSAAAWQQLETVGTLKIQPVSFLNGSHSLTPEGESLLDDAIQTLRHYPSFRLLIAGHTTNQGDADANKALSLARAQAVADYLSSHYQLDSKRLMATGFGGEQPLQRQPGESLRAWRYRLPRVELILKRDPI